MLRRVLLTCVVRDSTAGCLQMGKAVKWTCLMKQNSFTSLSKVVLALHVKQTRMCSTDPPTNEDDSIMEMLSRIPTGDEWLGDEFDHTGFDDVKPSKTDSTALPGHIIRGIRVPNEETHSAIVAGQRYDQLPIAHIRATYNNTLVTITEHDGTKRLGSASGGTVGFKNAKKKTTIAAQVSGFSAGQHAMKNGITHVRVALKGIGKGRLAACKGLEEAGLEIVSLTDVSTLNWGSNFPKKRRRL